VVYLGAHPRGISPLASPLFGVLGSRLVPAFVHQVAAAFCLSLSLLSIDSLSLSIHLSSPLFAD